MEIEFNIGDIVTLKSHPLLNDKYIKGDGKLVPPYMVITEILNENKKKRTHSEELGKQIADLVKYTCVFFDDNRTEFKEVYLYKSELYKHNFQKEKNDENDINNYDYGKTVSFITNEIETNKQRESKKTTTTILKKEEGKKETRQSEIKTIQNIVNFSSPDFVLCGIKKNENKSDFHSNGSARKVVSEILYKVKWFNSNQMKFSEKYLPAECFTDIQPFETKVPHNTKKEDN